MNRVKSALLTAAAALGMGCASAPSPQGAQGVAPVPPLSAGVFTVALSTSETAGEFVFTVTNTSDAAARFCTYHTPFEGIANNIFAVVGPSGAVDYVGPMKKRAAPGPDDYRTLAPGAQASVPFVLADRYPTPAGSYTLQYKQTAISGLPDSNVLSFTAP